MYKRKPRLRRVELATPGSNEKMMGKAAGSDADLVFLDLEDAVAPDEKIGSREKICNALNQLDWSGKTTCVRVNDLTTEWAYGDIITVVENCIDVLDLIMLPKVLGPEDVLFLDILLTQIEKRMRKPKKIGIEVLIEDVQAMAKVDAIAASSPRLEALIYGVGDYSASQGIDISSIGGNSGYPGDIWHYGRHKITIAARCNGLDAIDGPFADFNDAETYKIEAERARILGLKGKWAIHPNQIAPAKEVFSPKPERVKYAREMIAAYEEAKKQGLGAVTFDGKMIDAATIKIVENTVVLADLIGM